MFKRIESPVLVVVFGASGDLTKRKLLPALYNLYRHGVLSDQFAFIGYARTANNDDGFRKQAEDDVREFAGSDFDEKIWNSFAPKLHYLSGNYDDRTGFEKLAAFIDEVNADIKNPGNTLFYLSTPPNVFEPITSLLSSVGLTKRNEASWRRLIIEKPFGHDLQSAKKLNAHLLGLFDEDQIFRIDHYLGKETVQNMLVFRFGNGIFEPIWNRNYVDHVQITVAENLDVGDRGGYYDSSGAIRDMVQNHLMQLVALTAMEPPVAFDDKAVRDQKVNALRAIRPLDPANVADWVVRAQYGDGKIDKTSVKGYKQAEHVNPHSTTDTFVAWKLEIDNWRWNGVPFYLRTGKALAQKLTEVNIVFRKPPQMLFAELEHEDFNTTPSNVLTLRIQPDESIYLTFGAKKPGPAVDVERVRMQFSYTEAFGAKSAEAYERLLLDALIGDGTLFIRADETEVAWDRVSRVLDGWRMIEEQANCHGRYYQLPTYAAGSWGPDEADEMMRRDGRYWRNWLK